MPVIDDRRCPVPVIRRVIVPHGYCAAPVGTLPGLSHAAAQGGAASDKLRPSHQTQPGRSVPLLTTAL